ncbi:MAG: metal ABC transporter ATP-binding protein [Chitinispirillaceae bacterium]
MSSTDSVLRFENVCFSYDEEEILHEINFSIKNRWFVGIVGPNGGGKTTLLRLALGLEKPDRGGVTLLGDSPSKARKRIGYVMQHMQFDERFPARVLDIVLMGLARKRMLGFYGRQDRCAALEALEQVGIARLGQRPFASLSGGQRQRALIAQALVSRPRVLMLDEPTANIDSSGETAINELLRTLAGEVTILMVSHNINTVLDCASHVLCVNRSATLNPLSEMHPDLIARAKGGGIALLHHELSCRVFDRSDARCAHNQESRKKTGGGK